MSSGDVIKSQERELIFRLARELTGITSQQNSRYEIVILNVARRVQATGSKDLQDYLRFVTDHERELGFLISALTIHTTSWFREMPHYQGLERDLTGLCSAPGPHHYRLLSAACSSGEEVYSFGMVLESFRRRCPGLEYELYGIDVDPISIQRAEAGIYRLDDLSAIPQHYRRFLLPRPKLGAGRMIIDPEIRRRTKLEVGNILHDWSQRLQPFDQAVCRNVLIYFQKEQVEEIVRNLLGVVKSSGSLTLGHCEMIDGRAFDLTCLGNCTYRRTSRKPSVGSGSRAVLVVDDSASVRLWLSSLLEEAGFHVLAVESAEAATTHLAMNAVDLIMLDLNLPGQHGLSWLQDQRKAGLSAPVIVFTDVNAAEAPNVLDALSGPAQDYVNKALVGARGSELIDRIAHLISAHQAKLAPLPERGTEGDAGPAAQVQLITPDVILIGASTGGTDALAQILAHMPPDSPPVVCVQHIPPEFARAFLERLSAISGLKIGAIGKGIPLLPGHLYMPTGDVHMGIRLQGDKVVAYTSNDDRVAGHRPSVDYLFQSASLLRDRKIMACLLTGMGRDGARGLLALRQIGAITFAQDEMSSVVWGMPGEAVKLGAPVLTGNLHELRTWMLLAIQGGGGMGLTAKRRAA